MPEAARIRVATDDKMKQIVADTGFAKMQTAEALELN